MRLVETDLYPLAFAWWVSPASRPAAPAPPNCSNVQTARQNWLTEGSVAFFDAASNRRTLRNMQLKRRCATPWSATGCILLFPAAGGPGARRDLRCRGAALELGRAGAGEPSRVHPGGRTRRAHRRHRRMGDAAGLPAGGDLAARRTAAAAGGREPLASAAAAAGPRAGGYRGTHLGRCRPRVPGSRTHRAWRWSTRTTPPQCCAR